MVLVQQLLVGTAGFGRNVLFYSLVLLHVIAALVGFGSIGFAGTYAAGAYLPDDGPLVADPEPSTVPAQPEEGTAHADEGPGEEVARTEVARTELASTEVASTEVARTEEEKEEKEEKEVVLAGTEEEVVEVTTAAGTHVRAEDPESEELRRYFAHPARLWGVMLLVPFLGMGALEAQPNGKGLDHLWVFGAVAVWLAATLVASSLVVPALHQMQAVLLKSSNPEASPASRSALRIRFARAGRIASRAAAFCDVLFFVALALMIFRP